jgi:hypothetical protein
MPTPALKSFAKESGKPIAEVERLWGKAKKLANDEGHKESDGDSFYAYVTGILKKMLGLKSTLEEQVGYLLGEVLEESVEIEDELSFKLRKVPDLVKQETKFSTEKIVQGFILKPNDEIDTRIRKTVFLNTRGMTEYTMTTKFRPKNEESEETISESMFNAYWKDVAFSKQEKIRYKWNGWDIDEFPDGGVVAEYEKGWSKERPSIPSCFEVIK